MFLVANLTQYKRILLIKPVVCIKLTSCCLITDKIWLVNSVISFLTSSGKCRHIFTSDVSKLAVKNFRFGFGGGGAVKVAELNICRLILHFTHCFVLPGNTLSNRWVIFVISVAFVMSSGLKHFFFFFIFLTRARLLRNPLLFLWFTNFW